MEEINKAQAAEEKPILQVKNLSVLIKDRFLVKNVTFSLQKGECLGLLGDVKTGKTSLIKAISGSLPINPGQVYIEGKDIYNNKKVLKTVSACFDPPVFFKYQTVYENLKFLSSLNESHDKEKIIRILNRFNLAHKLHTRVLFLSYHEKKLMGLALALLTEPKLLLLDEPFKDVPEESYNLIKSAIADIKAQGTTIIMTAKVFESIEAECDRVAFMENREIIKFMDKQDFSDIDALQTYAFIKVKYPHFAGKLIVDNFSLPVKLMGLNVLFEADEDITAQIVRLVTKNNIALYRAGYLNKKTEKVLANLAPYFKEEE